jgi:hypothetical protein
MLPTDLTQFLTQLPQQAAVKVEDNLPRVLLQMVAQAAVVGVTIQKKVQAQPIKVLTAASDYNY